jgi:hypothetical protein
LETLATLFDLIKLLLVLLLAYVTGAALFGARGERCGGGMAAVRFTGGFCLLAFFFLLSKVAGSALVFFAGLPLLMIALVLMRRPELRCTLAPAGGATAAALALIVLTALPVLVMGARMAAGDYPAVFFAGDSPFFLQQVYALMRSDAYPPPSLETWGFSFKYHYGFQAFVALTSLLSGLKPHFVMFGVVHPLLELLTGIVLYSICRRLTASPRAALLCLLLVLLGSRQYLFAFNLSDPAWWNFITSEENYSFRFPNGPDAAGLLIALCAIRCTLEFAQKNLRLAALFFTALLPVFKLPYLIPVSLGLGLIYVYELQQRFSWRLLIEIAATAALSVLTYVVFAQGAATAGGSAGFQFGGFLAMSMPWDNETLYIVCGVIVITAVVTRLLPSTGMLRLLGFALAPYLLFALWRIDIENEYQIFSLAARLLALFAAVYLAAGWLDPAARSTAWRHGLFVALLAVLTLPATLSLFNHLHVVTADPARGHEYVDNRAVAAALQTIPLENTLIATNDLRYPANDFIRDYRQFQLAGIFGHRNFGADLVYGGFLEAERNRYARFLKLFQLKNWPAAQIDQLRQSVAITHLLIHKPFAHAQNIPLTRIFENDDYIVYRF